MVETLHPSSSRWKQVITSPWRWMARHAEGLQVLLTLVAVVSSVSVAYVGIKVAEQANTIADSQAQLMRSENSPFLRIRSEPPPDEAQSVSRDLVIYNVGAPIGRFEASVAPFLHICVSSENAAAPGALPWSDTRFPKYPLRDVFTGFTPAVNFTGEIGRWSDESLDRSYVSQMQRVVTAFNAIPHDQSNVFFRPCILHYVEIIHTNALGELSYEYFTVGEQGQELLNGDSGRAVMAVFDYRSQCQSPAIDSAEESCFSIHDLTGQDAHALLVETRDAL